MNDVQSAPSTLKYGVPQDLVLGLILFTMYTQPLGSVIQQLGATSHFFFFLLMIRSYMIHLHLQSFLAWLET